MNNSPTSELIKFCRLVMMSIAMFLTYHLQAQNSSANTLPSSTINFNPLGFLQFGPIVQAEYKVSESGYFAPHVRIPYLGLLYHVINLNDRSDDVTVSPVALGVGGGYKHFFPTDKGAWYAGAIAEYSFGSSKGNDGKVWESKFSNIALLSNGGFRWRSAESKRYISVGGFVGLYTAVRDEWWYISSPGNKKDERSTTAIVMLELAFGLERK